MKLFRDAQSTYSGGAAKVYPESKIRSLRMNVFSDCPNCGTQNDTEFEEDEYDQPDSFLTSCYKCKKAFHITLPKQKL